MKIDVAGARARAGSRYPKPFDEPCRNKTRRRLGLAVGLTQFGVNLLELGPGAWSSWVLAKGNPSLSMSSLSGNDFSGYFGRSFWPAASG